MNKEQARELNEFVDSYAQKLDKIRAFINDKDAAHGRKITVLRALDEALENVVNEAGL